MFVRNRKDVDFKYRKSGKCIVLKANTITFVDDSLVTAKELMNCYGQRIEIINQATNNTEVVKESVVPVEVQEPVNNENINNILSQIEEELKLNENTDIKVDEALNENTDVKDFLEGKTDKLPEGTEELEEDEVLKLLVQAGLGNEVNVNPSVNNTDEGNKTPIDDKKVVNKDNTKPVKKTQAKTGKGKRTTKK